MKEMYQKLAILYGIHYEKTGSYAIVRFNVVCTILASFYESFVSSKEIIPIEELKQEAKQRLWDAAGAFHTDKEKRLKAAKAIYSIEVIALNI